MTPTQPPPSPPSLVEPAPTPTPPPAGEQGTWAPTSASEAPTDDRAAGDAPAGRKGFQIALRTGVAVPLGEVDKGEKMSDTFGLQVPIIADIGAKIIPELFVGGYLGLAVGGVGDTAKAACDKVAVDCTSVGFRFGVEAQYHIVPDGKLNPWVGYGIGYEIAGVRGSKNDNKLTAGLGGVEYAHLMAGFDYRITRVFGIGPFADFSLGKYSVATTEVTINGVPKKNDGDIANTTLHEWLMLGVKVTFFP
jgi:hypothetical protein